MILVKIEKNGKLAKSKKMFYQKINENSNLKKI